ncbi:MAG TPA: DNA polymerase I [Acidimicrobiia bacterium]|nr:DNA polymerase I [Acidimicrobiia bacterium]
MPTLVLIDGHSIAYRAFFALPEDLATTSGQVTNAAYGFTRMLIRLLADHHPEGIAVAWDVSRQTFRSEQYPDYKANRSVTPDNFKSQLPLIRDVLETLGVKQIQLEGYEADDVIATVAGHAARDGWRVLAVTGDRDAFQLIDDDINVVYTRRGITDVVMADAAWVSERYGITPSQYVEYAALRGDTSDNLPGVPGVGEKTAAKLIASYGSLEGIYDHLDEQTPKLRENLAEYRDQVFLNRKLMTLVADLDLDVDPADLARGEWDRTRTRDLFTSLEFHSMWEDLLAVQPDAVSEAEVLETEGRMATEADLAAVVALPEIVCDWYDDGLAVWLDDGAVLIPVDRLDRIKDRLEDPDVPKLFHDGKRVIRRLDGLGIDVTGVGFDTALAAYVVNPASRAYDLAELAGRYLGVELESPDSEADAAAQAAFDFSEGPDLDAVARRVEAIARLSAQMRTELADRHELELFEEIELPLVAVLARMESAGIAVDRAYLEGLGDDLRIRLAELERKIHDHAGEPFNVNSTDQLRMILFDRLGLPVSKKTSTGKPSTDASVLEKLRDHHPLVADLLEYREYEKLRSTYVDGYLPLVRSDGRIHTTFNQMAAATGRLSSEEPNLQNIPVRSESGMTIRRAFVPREGWTFIVADYSQIELRVMAHLTEDEGLVSAFREGQDIHTATASRVFGVPADLVSGEMRRRAKVINFGLLYGMEAFGLAQRLDISREEAQTHMEAYFAQFPNVKAFLDGVVTEARRNGFTSTLFGRRRYLPELKSDNFRIRQMGERMALNAPVQGTAADIIKLAMISLDRELITRKMDSTMLLQIHDELILESPPGELDAAIALTRQVMEHVTTLNVPLDVDINTGPDLASVKS